MMKLRAYIGGTPVDLSQHTNPKGVLIEAELPDGRTVQLSVGDCGNVYLRGWGNIPSKVGCMDSLNLSCTLPYKDPH